MNPRTILNRIEKLIAIPTVVLLIYRIFLGTSLDFFLLSAVTVMAVFYLWFGFFLFNRILPLELADPVKRQNLDSFRVVSSIFMGVVYSVCIISILFSIFFYPRMQFMLGFSLFLVLTAASLSAVYHWLNKQSGRFLRQFYLRSLILGGFIALTLSISVEKRLNLLYSDHPGFIEAYCDHRNEPNDPEAFDRLREERSKFR